MTTFATHFEPWLIFKNAIVRQLAFAIASPNIIQHIPSELQIKNAFHFHDPSFWNEQYQSYLPRLIELDEQPDELTQFVKKLKSTRLGLRFEYLMWFWLQDPKRDQSQFSLLDHSIQIIDGQNTLGEIDFLIFNHQTQQVEQWEVALKFYLAESCLDLQNWYGLNRSDTLFRKLNHFTQKQFQFDRTKNFKIDRKIAVIKGQLYLPLGVNQSEIPQWVNTTRNVGTWGTQILDGYVRLQRSEWISINYLQPINKTYWWTDGLYYSNLTHNYYMHRTPKLKSPRLQYC